MTSYVIYIVATALVLTGACVRPRVLKQLLLLAASYVFYARGGTAFLAVLIASSLINFAFGELLRRRITPGRLWLGIIANVSLLGFFKYLPPLASGASDVLHRIVMPAGMSFWTFQALSYLFDIYREEELEPTLLEFCLYMSFWPTVLMGPICRLSKLLPQFREVHGISPADLAAGLRRIGTGLFMKLVLAEFLGSSLAAASRVGTNSAGTGRAWGGLDVWFIAIGFGFQVFFDFAGYSHIVIGAARLLGFRLAENFDSPYLSTTPSIFWTRWHMSLSSWIRDYVFVPAATLRREPWWRYLALFLSMVLFGIWHGATITFLLWGVYHGIFLVLYRIVEQYQRTSRARVKVATGGLFSWAVTFLGISLSWILFRTSDLNEALAMFRAVLSPASYLNMVLPANYYQIVLISAMGYFAYSGLIGSALAREKWQTVIGGIGIPGGLSQISRASWQKTWWWRGPVIATLTILAALAVAYQASHATPFIYTLF
jgi:alginate O-acetyltransferase complex protein AlgI